MVGSKRSHKQDRLKSSWENKWNQGVKTGKIKLGQNRRNQKERKTRQTNTRISCWGSD